MTAPSAPPTAESEPGSDALRRPARLANATKLRLLGLIAVLLVVIGIVLVITGGDDEQPSAPSTTTTSLAPGATPVATLPLDDTSIAAVNHLAGLSIPTDAGGFLTTFPEARTQLDVSFTLPPDQVAAFVSGSGLAAPVAGTRVISHSSPLWKLNPEGEVAGAADTNNGVARAVETVPEGDKVRVRIVLSQSS